VEVAGEKAAESGAAAVVAILGRTTGAHGKEVVVAALGRTTVAPGRTSRTVAVALAKAMRTTGTEVAATGATGVTAGMHAAMTTETAESQHAMVATMGDQVGEVAAATHRHTRLLRGQPLSSPAFRAYASTSTILRRPFLLLGMWRVAT